MGCAYCRCMDKSCDIVIGEAVSRHYPNKGPEHTCTTDGVTPCKPCGYLQPLPPDELTRLRAEVAKLTAERDEARGTSACPICGNNEPHRHGREEVNDWVCAQARRFGYVAKSWPQSWPHNEERSADDLADHWIASTWLLLEEALTGREEVRRAYGYVFRDAEDAVTHLIAVRDELLLLLALRDGLTRQRNAAQAEAATLRARVARLEGALGVAEEAFDEMRTRYAPGSIGRDEADAQLAAIRTARNEGG